jgi:branched-chain amino acid transport system permease protein
MSGYLVSLFPLIGINIILAMGLNVIAGFCGQISLGQAAFYGIGAYSTALLALAGWPLWAVLPVVTLFAGICGVVIGLASLRVRHDFLAVTTIAVNFLFLGIVRKNAFLGGEVGFAGIPAHGLGQYGFVALIVALVLATVALCIYIKSSWLGFAFISIAEDEHAARAIAIPVPAFKLAAFFVASALSGLAGGLYCYYARFITPDAFSFLVSVSILAMVVIGGIGSVWGVLAGAVLLTLFPEAFRFAGDYRQLIFGVMLVLVMRFSPAGLAGLVTASLAKAGHSLHRRAAA